jgi:hypothetical protein
VRRFPGKSGKIGEGDIHKVFLRWNFSGNVDFLPFQDRADVDSSKPSSDPPPQQPSFGDIISSSDSLAHSVPSRVVMPMVASPYLYPVSMTYADRSQMPCVSPHALQSAVAWGVYDSKCIMFLIMVKHVRRGLHYGI